MFLALGENHYYQTDSGVKALFSGQKRLFVI